MSWLFFHEVLEHSGLADLARAGYDNDFEVFRIITNQRLKRTSNVQRTLKSSQIRNRFWI